MGFGDGIKTEGNRAVDHANEEGEEGISAQMAALSD